MTSIIDWIWGTHDEGSFSKDDEYDPSLAKTVAPIIGGLKSTSNSAVDGFGTLPTLFTWSHGGKTVHLLTSMDGFKKKHTMSQSTHDFSKIIELPPGREVQYRFEIDGVLMCDPGQKHVRGNDGGYVNSIQVELKHMESFINNRSVCNFEFSQVMPDPDLYLRQPPNGPSHLGEIILNEVPDNGTNPLLLPKPSHVVYNHVYVSERKEKDVMVLAMTSRFQDKSLTTIFYKHTDSIPRLRNPDTDIDEGHFT